MKVLMINGSPHSNGCTFTALNEVGKVLQSYGIGFEIVNVGKGQVSGCIACGGCNSTKRCVLGGKVNEVLDRIDEFDGLIVGSPVHYSAPTGNLISFLDRLFYAGGSMMAGKLGACVVSCRRGGATASFDVLNKYFSISNMPIVTSQYWNQVHGSCPEDVSKDLEGLQIMRTLGENFNWLLKCIEQGRKNGINLPLYEDKLRTNFI